MTSKAIESGNYCTMELSSKGSNHDHLRKCVLVSETELNSFPK